MSSTADTTKFPDPVYAKTVLGPLFDHSKVEFVGPLALINRAHNVMLVETAILSRPDGAAIARGLLAVEAALDPASMHYTGEVEDLFFAIEAENGHVARAVAPSLAGSEQCAERH